MKYISYIAVVALLLLTAVSSFGNEVRVSTPRELIEAIESDATILIIADELLITEAADISTEYVRWYNYGDGPAPEIYGVTNLTIRGGDDTHILGTPRYVDVLTFRDCEDVTLENLVIGHTVAAEGCMGGVVRYVDCADMKIRGCELFGSGTYGVISEYSYDLYMEDTSIYECTVGAISSWESTGITAKSCRIISNAGYGIISLYATYDVYFTRCLFENNSGETIFDLGSGTEGIMLTGCHFRENTAVEFSNAPELIDMEESVTFEMNTFDSGTAPGDVADPGSLEPIPVTDVESLLRAVGSNREIAVLPGVYNLSDAAGGSFPHVRWEKVYDGWQPVVTGVENCTIRGVTDSPEIMIEPRYAFVLAFTDCSDVTLENLVIGHTEAGFCAGGVIYADDTRNIAIDGCVLRGSGTWGVEFNEVVGARISQSVIDDCTSGVALIRSSSDIVFTLSLIANNAEWDMFDFTDVSSVRIEDCSFQNNSGLSMFRIDNGSRDIMVRNNEFRYNHIDVFASGQRFELFDNTYETNGFALPEWEKSSSEAGDDDQVDPVEPADVVFKTYVDPIHHLSFPYPEQWHLYTQGDSPTTRLIVMTDTEHGTEFAFLPLLSRESDTTDSPPGLDEFEAAAESFRDMLETGGYRLEDYFVADVRTTESGLYAARLTGIAIHKTLDDRYFNMDLLYTGETIGAFGSIEPMDRAQLYGRLIDYMRSNVAKAPVEGR